MDKRFEQQLQFIFEIDKVKSIIRKTKIFDGSKRENDAEHSWHLAMMAMVLQEHSNAPVDVSRVIKMVLIHDLVEIDAGDYIVYTDNNEEKYQKELEGAKRIFGLLPDDMSNDMFNLWMEFEARETPDAKFAAALDRVEPIIQDYFNNSWQDHNITSDMVRNVCRDKINEGSETLWSYIELLLKECEDKKYFG